MDMFPEQQVYFLQEGIPEISYSLLHNNKNNRCHNTA